MLIGNFNLPLTAPARLLSARTQAAAAASVDKGPPLSLIPPRLTAPAQPTVAAAPHYPVQIIIIRHAEKPDDNDNSSDPAGLSAQGQERAQALADAIPARYPHIDYLFASAASKNSHRPIDTITPLSQKLGLGIDTSYADKQYADLAQTLETDPKYAGKTVLICWHHGKIPQLTQALGATPPVSPWPGQTFDRIWQIDYGADQKATIQNLPQHVLPGDSTR